MILRNIVDVWRSLIGYAFMLSLFFPFKSFSQSFDSLYYKKISGENLTVRAVLYHNILHLDIEELNKNMVLNYLSNNSMNVGIGISHSKIPFDIFMGYGVGNALNRDYLKTKSTDFQLHRYARKYVIDVFYQYYKGFYIEDTNLTFAEANKPDLSISTTGIFGQYIFNAKKFSYRAAFNQKEKQMRSAGSFLLGGGIYFFHLKSKELSMRTDENPIKSVQLGINAGYSYNWAVDEHWLINGSLSLSANFEKENRKARYFYDKFSVKPAALVRLSCFYNAEKWSMGLSGVVNMAALTYTRDWERHLVFGRFNITYLRRFNFKGKP